MLVLVSVLAAVVLGAPAVSLVGGYYELSTGRVLFSETVHMLSRLMLVMGVAPGTAQIALEPGWATAADGTPVVRVRGRA